MGSEGTLGIVTKIVLKLLPHPKYDLLMLVPLTPLEKAGEAVSAIYGGPALPQCYGTGRDQRVEDCKQICR